MLIANRLVAISPAVTEDDEGGSGAMFVDIACPKYCEFGDVRGFLTIESIWSRWEIRDSGEWRYGYYMGG